MFISLSNYRLRETAIPLASIEATGTKFVILRSINVSVVTQYYIVCEGWENKSIKTQIEPLAQVNVRAGNAFFVSWQPELFKVKETKKDFLDSFRHFIHA